MAGYIDHHQQESGAMAVFLAASEGTLEQRARLWEAAKKQAEQGMKEKLKEQESKE